jgi:hypothetical protein
MYITIINDCADANASARQQTRVAALFGIQPSFVGVSGSLSEAAELEAAGMLIDCLDAAGDAEGIILVNVAPRSGAGKKYQNGTPFCYFRYKNTLILSSVAGLTLSLAKKFKLTGEVRVFDIKASVTKAAEDGLISRAEAEHIVTTQFRSFDFLPRAAKWLYDGRDLGGEVLSLREIPDAPQAVWWVDNFGNCKTTLTKDELPEGEKVETRCGTLTRYERLSQVPDGEVALIEGSSGLGDSRFLELVIQGQSAAEKFEITAGDTLFA